MKRNTKDIVEDVLFMLATILVALKIVGDISLSWFWINILMFGMIIFIWKFLGD